MKHVITTGKITTDHLTGQRVLWQYYELSGLRVATPYACRPEEVGMMLRYSANRAEINRRLRTRR